MDYLTSVAITIGVLAGLWSYGSLTYGLLIWVAFISWACYFASGTKVEGLTKTLVCNLVGALWAFIALKVIGVLATNGMAVPVAAALAVAVVCIIMVLQARISILGFIPGSFAGAAAFFGASLAPIGAHWSQPVVALIAGAVLGYLSDIAAKAIMKKEKPAA